MHRAVVPSSSIRPVDTSIQTLGVKRTSGFMRACGELTRHRELLAQPPPSMFDDSDDDQDSLYVTPKRRKVNSRLLLLVTCI